jgi:hypothetical protein
LCRSAAVAGASSSAELPESNQNSRGGDAAEVDRVIQSIVVVGQQAD